MQKQHLVQNSLPKAERLCSHKALAELYERGEAFLVYPLRCVYRVVESDDNAGLRILVSVPKRNHKRAVHRNLLKRRIREAYRLNRVIIKNAIYKNHSSVIKNQATVRDVVDCPEHDQRDFTTMRGMTLEFSLTYIAKEIKEYQIIENAVKKILKELSNRCAVTSD